MKTIIVTVSTQSVCSRVEEEIQVPDDISDEELHEIAKETLFQLIDWSYYEKEDEEA